MSSFLQTSDGDISVANGRASIVTGATEKAQKIRGRLRLFQGEWFLDTRIGVPYYTVVLIKNPDLEIIKRLYRRVVMSVPGIADVQELDLVWNRVDRSLAYSLRAVDDEGTPISGGSGVPFIVGAQ